MLLWDEEKNTFCPGTIFPPFHPCLALVGKKQGAHANIRIHPSPSSLSLSQKPAKTKFQMEQEPKLPAAAQSMQSPTPPLDLPASSKSPEDISQSIETVSQSTELSAGTLRGIQELLKIVKKSKDATPFLHPVDPIALGIPDYPRIISRPMDVSTIEANLRDKKYLRVDDFVADFQLMLKNCFTYNPPETVVHKMGKALEALFAKNLRLVTGPSASAGIEKKRKNSIAAADGAGGVPKLRRASSAKASRMSADEYKRCQTIFQHVIKKTNVVWPFMQPVDPVALAIPDYFNIIKEPMDFGTIKRKLESGNAYTTFSEFERDVRLIFTNCYTYNAPDSDVVSLCKQAEALFNSKIASTSSRSTSSSSTVPHSSRTGSLMLEYSDEDDGVEDSDSERLRSLKQQLVDIKNRINEINQKRKNRRLAKGPADLSHEQSTGAKVKKHSRGVGSVGGNVSGSLQEELSFEEKRQLSFDINYLPPDELTGVVEIIQESMPTLRNSSSEEIELDIDTLNVKTLRRLQSYVIAFKTRQSKNAAPLTSMQQSSSLTSVVPPQPTSSEDDDSDSD